LKGWEETVNVSIATMLRTTLSKGSKEQILSQLQLKIPTDVVKIEKHLKTLHERIEKGSVLVHGVERKKSNDLSVLQSFKLNRFCNFF
jgi:hypothetical protein